MTKRVYPHMRTQDEFPDVGQVDVWKFKNDFDYSQFDNVQMRITVCTVPWDVGLIHVGNQQIAGLGNVVAFESDEEREEYFSSIEDKFVFETEYRKFYAQSSTASLDGKARLPIPVEACTRFNYLIVEYLTLPVAYEGMGTNKFFFFIREPSRIASNTTEVQLMLDSWQTFSPGRKMQIPYMMLERGHAPMAALSADVFLKNPLNNTRYVTGEDVNYGTDGGTVVADEKNIVFNEGEVYACLVCDSNVNGIWGSAENTWTMPITHSLTTQGVPSYQCIAVPASDFNAFLLDVDMIAPQFKQCVHAVFFASTKMIGLASTFKFCGHDVYGVSATEKTLDLIDLKKSSFGYDEKYRDIAKLYTWPYAHIEIVKDDGETEIVRVEDTTGTLDLQASLSIAYPFIRLTSHVLGVGGSSRRTVSFKNLNERKIKIGGHWQSVKLDWDIPTFAVVQDADRFYDYAEFYDRAQAKDDADVRLATENNSNQTAYDNAITQNQAAYDNALTSNAAAQSNSNASATAAKANANASAATAKNISDRSALAARDNAKDTATTTRSNVRTMAAAAKTNSDADADVVTNNAALDNACTDANKDLRVEFNTRQTLLQNAYNARGVNISNQVTNATTWASQAATKENAAISSIGSVVGAALAASPSGLVDAATSYMQAAVATNLMANEAEITTNANSANLQSSSTNNNVLNAISETATNAETNNEKARTSGQAANTASTMKANATRTRDANYTTADDSRDTEHANADRTYAASVNNNIDEKNTSDANAQRSYDTAIANASRTKNAADANAQRSKTAADANAERSKATADENANRDWSNAYQRIASRKAQQDLEPTKTFGEFAHGETATTRPTAVFAQVVTQGKGEIAAAGDELLRFGYNCSMQWDFETWNVMQKFSYWKVADLWFQSLDIPDKYADGIRFALMGGVTVWRRPEYIGHTSIYDNGV